MSEEVPRRQTRVLDKQRLRTFLLGGAAGILAGIFLAPRSGRELRGSIRERAGEVRERGRETLFETQERMQERLAEAREASPRPPDAGDVAPGTQPLLRDVSRDAGERSEELRRKVRETRARLKERLDGSREDRDLGPGR
jgi:gas vesicle protein